VIYYIWACLTFCYPSGLPADLNCELSDAITSIEAEPEDPSEQPHKQCQLIAGPFRDPQLKAREGRE
jgi:hypothetical protein